MKNILGLSNRLIIFNSKMSDQEIKSIHQEQDQILSTCERCGQLQASLDVERNKSQQLEEINDKLTKQMEQLLEDNESQQKQIESLRIELSSSQSAAQEDRKIISQQNLLQSLGTGIILGSTLSQSEVVGLSQANEDLVNGTGLNLKKIQQDLRVSKKAEQLAKEKLAQIKKTLDRTERDFSKYREDSQTRLDQLTNEIQILQKHYDQLQNSINENELEMRSNGSSNNKGSELVKIIDEYSKQADLKAKEIEQLQEKLDKKAEKLDLLKKSKAESDSKNLKLRSTVENMKTFLKLINNNYLKSLKQQVSTLKDQYQSMGLEFFKENQNLQTQAQTQILRIHRRDNSTLLRNFQLEKDKSLELESLIQALKVDHNTQIKKIQEEHQVAIDSSSQKHKAKVANLKQRIEKLSQSQQSGSDEKNQIKDQLTSRIIELEKELQLSNLRMESEKEKFKIQLSEQTKDIQSQNIQIQDLKQKEIQVLQKLEVIEGRHREELQRLTERHENDKLTWIQREAGVSGAREADRLKELRDLLEAKAKEKDDEVQRMRVSLKNSEDEARQTKEDDRKKSEIISELKFQQNEWQKQILQLQGDLAKQKQNSHSRKQACIQLTTRATQDEVAIKELNAKIKSLEEQVVNLKLNEIPSLTQKLDQADKTVIGKELRIEELENQLDQVKFDLHDEIKEKEDLNSKHIEQIQQLSQEICILTATLTQKEQEIKLLGEQISELSEQKLRLEQRNYEVQSSIPTLVNADLAQEVVQSVPKKKKLVKKRKMRDGEAQTEAFEDDIIVQSLEIDYQVVQEQVLAARAKILNSQKATAFTEEIAPKPEAERVTETIITSPKMVLHHVGKWSKHIYTYYLLD